MSKIIMIKYPDNGESLFADYYTGSVDRIWIEDIPVTSFPIFDITAELTDGILRRKAGEFSIEFSLLQTTLSTAGFNIKDFLTLKRGSGGFTDDNYDRSHRFLFAMTTGDFTFFGTFKSKDVAKDFTYSEGKWNVSFIVRDAIQEMADYVNTLTTDFDEITDLTNFTFEDYMAIHCADFAPNFYFQSSTSFGQRIGDTSCVFTGESYAIPTNYTDWRIVSRWETFKELAKGLGFDWDLELLYEDIGDIFFSSNLRPRQLFKLRIFWKEDIAAETPITLTQALSHREIVISKTLKYLFLGYRHAVFTRLPEGQITPEYTGIRGIIYDGDTITETDTEDTFNSGDSYPAYPFFARTENPAFDSDQNANEILYYITGNGQLQRFYLNQVNDIPLTLYSHPGFGGGYAVAGSIAYARIFNCTNYNFLPIQRYVINSYSRYIVSAGKKGKEIEVNLQDVPGLRLYKHIKFDDGEGLQSYEVVGITGLDTIKQKVKLLLNQL